MKKFSVLMSVYKKEKAEFLEKALKSILINQSLIPNQVVLVKDGPLTYELEKVINKYVKKFENIIFLVTLKENVGLGKALNVGLNHCKYEIVARMDTDDIAIKDRFKIQLEYMNKYPEIDVLGGYIYEFDQTPGDISRIKTMPLTHEEISNYIKYRNPINHMTVMFKKSAALESGNYQPLYFNEDYYLWIRMFIKGKKFSNISMPLVYARIGNGFIQRRGSKLTIDSWKVLQKLMYENKIINSYEKNRNLAAIKLFVYMPDFCRSGLYKFVLRKSIEEKNQKVDIKV